MPDKPINWGRWITVAVVAYLVWYVIDSSSRQSTPSQRPSNEVCEYYDADPTQWTDMQEDCYVP